MSEKFDFRPGDVIDYCGDHYTVVLNHGSSGVVAEGDDLTTLIKFEWEFSGEKCQLVRRYPHDIHVGGKYYLIHPTSGVITRFTVMGIAIRRLLSGEFETTILFIDGRYTATHCLVPEVFFSQLVPDKVVKALSLYWSQSLCESCKNLYYPGLLYKGKCSHCLVASGEDGEFSTINDNGKIEFHTMPSDSMSLIREIDMGMQRLSIIGEEATPAFDILDGCRHRPVEDTLSRLADLLPIKLP